MPKILKFSLSQNFGYGLTFEFTDPNYNGAENISLYLLDRLRYTDEDLSGKPNLPQ